jgi:lysophospholipase L1-like esterase
MNSNGLSPEAEFLFDFNVHYVPAIVGMDIPPAAAAVMLGITEAQFVAYSHELESEVREAAERMLADARMAEAIDRLPIPVGGTVMTIGDSITTFRRGYARVLEAMIAIGRADGDIRFLNVAQSGYTSTHCLEETYTRFLAETPDVVFIKVGVNDSKLFGGADTDGLVSLAEYRSNMAAMVGAFLEHTSARPILISPAPVAEAVANNYAGFEDMRMRWRNSDIAAKADAVSEIAARHALTYVDLIDAFGDSPSLISTSMTASIPALPGIA